MALRGAVIRIQGDSRDAQRALDGTGSSARSAGAGLAAAGRLAIASARSMERVSVVTTGLNSAMQIAGRVSALARRGFMLLRKSTEAYLRSSATGTELLGGFRARLDGITASLAEVLLGTDNVADGNEDLQEILGIVTGTLGQLVGMFRLNRGEAGAFVREGVARVVEGLGLLVEIGGVAINTGRALEAGWLVGKAAVLALASASVTLTTVLLEGVVGAFQGVTGAAGEAASTIGGFAEQVPGLRGLGRSISSAGDRLSRFSASADDAGDRLADLRTTINDAADDGIANATERLGEIGDAMVETTELTSEWRERLADLAQGVRDGTVDELEFAAAVARGNGAVGERVELLERYFEALRVVLQVEAERFAQLKANSVLQGEKAEEIAQAQADANIARIEAVREAQQAAQEATLKSLDIEGAARDRASQALEQYAGASLNALAAVIEGQKTAAQAAIGFVAETLDVLATGALAEAAMMVFQPHKGGPVGAGGLFAAAIAAKGVAAALGAASRGRGGRGGGGGAVSAGIAPPSTSVSSTSTSVSFINNFGGLADPREVQRAQSAAITDSRDRGYLPASATFGVP